MNGIDINKIDVKNLIKIGGIIYGVSKLGTNFLLGLAVGYYVGKKGIPSQFEQYLPASGGGMSGIGYTHNPNLLALPSGRR